jgi:membrane associated rhomboid family serine protease
MQPTQPPAGGYSSEPYGQFPGCYRHPDRPTGVRCVRCDRPICGECQRPASVGFQCPDDVAAGARTIRTTRTLFGSPASSNPAAVVPFITYGLISANVAIYLVTAFAPGGSLLDNTNTSLFRSWEMWPNGVGYLHQYDRLITSAFLHIGPLHLLLNMFALYVMGPGLERVMGWWRFLAVYLLAALGGSVAVLLFGAQNQPVAGASGAIYGLFAAFWILARVTGMDTRPIVITIVINFIFTISVPGISKLGHVGGFVVGGLATMALLGWTFQAWSLDRRTPRFQLVGLGAILVVLIALTVWRVADISSTPLTSPSRFSAAGVTSTATQPPPTSLREIARGAD